MCTIGKESEAKTKQSKNSFRGKSAKAYSVNDHDKKIYVETRINN